MTGPLDSFGVVELAVLERSGMIESRHLGAAVVITAAGSTALGDVDSLVYGRSSLKLFQAIAVLGSGVELEGEQLVLATASHAGTPRHLAVVRELLERAGLTEDALQCPLDWPLDSAARSGSEAPHRITMNCSGKHAAFLLACVSNGWPTENYLDPGHPLQLLVRQVVEEFTGERFERVGVDGCGAPVFATTLRGLATGVARVSSGTDPVAAQLTAAILAHPWAIDGPGRANTVVIEQLGLVCKGGAEGVMVMGAADGSSVALKIIDGSPRAATLVALELLAAAGVIDRAAADATIALTTERILGGGVPVGELRASELVRAAR